MRVSDGTLERVKGRTDLLLNVVERIGGIDCVTDQNNVRVGVREGTKTTMITRLTISKNGRVIISLEEPTRNLPDQRYPRAQARPSFHPHQHPRRSFRKR
jgi:hypothetical protein